MSPNHPPNPQSKPPLQSIISCHDFEHAASISLAPKTWSFYSCAATDLVTHKLNSSIYNQILFRPRTMTDVSTADTSTSILSRRSTLPLFCAPAALSAMVHPDGERALARACQKSGIPQCVSTSASFRVEDIFASISQPPVLDTPPPAPMTFFFQLYVDKNRAKSEELLRTAERLGAKAVFVTVDGPVQGKREADERVKADRELVSPMSGTRAKNDEKKGNSISRAMGSYIDPTLSWKDVEWLRRSTKLPIILKGIMTAQDAVLAMEHGIDGIVLSNHGGRNLDTTPPPMLVLLEIQKNSPEVLDKVEVFVDGGIKRGTDIFKALCLGAKAVGIGRGFLWALNYGEEGVEKFIDILRDELETTMKLCGITDLSQVHPGLVNTLAIDHLVPSGEGHPYAKWRPKARI
ncbi:hypothetical protein VE01_06607 [Pseudogymnoascus verrucosus]|uniref:L-lactate dehydrogenase (cytochrome) n=1 Tax=Pseudogymnoascus verrucosus TaxID=342668 RepID=A0A1B8GHM1_9PEZI|nr:uncharacterized protein VE01_06607 [Pseudogymnoascus verrucosus]OBT95295.1 hypothetical protein VE01_06607 [Pseudogymnoascus verrucosus]